MNIYIENESGYEFPFDIQKVSEEICEAVLDEERCPYDTEVNILITDNGGIQEFNSVHRGIDQPTDVLSFPNISFEEPSEFDMVEGNEADYFQPDSGELILGDIILNYERILSQAQEYGHSRRREFAFLVAHSMLHLCGYDHMTPDEAVRMEAKQHAVLDKTGITRDVKD